VNGPTKPAPHDASATSHAKVAGRHTICCMLSGGGRTMLNLHARASAGQVPIDIGLVIASRPCPGVERARALGLPVLVIPGEIESIVLGRVVRDHGCRWVALAGYLRRVRVPAGFEGRVVNIHPALLPAFGGPGMYGDRVHRAVIDAGCRVSGCTVHLCNEEYDRGPIVDQSACRVEPGDTPHTLAARVFELECDLFPRALADLVTGRATLEHGKVVRRSP
jgi:phosphoribosylglycinamide formyltransferase-1